MRTPIVKIIQLLDGTPAVYGKRQSGQSLAELALITPILIILLMGMVEIGWFANNYLNLLDVARAGARRGAVLQDQYSPLEWDNRASFVPYDWYGPGQNDYTDQGLLLGDTSRLAMPYTGTSQEQQAQDTMRNLVRTCDTRERTFYQEVACVMLASMDPLELMDNNIDDIVISGFSLARITDPAGGTVILGPNTRPAGAGVDTNVVVVGRYPSNANECEVTNAGTGQAPNLAIGRRPGDYRDPFDFNENGARDIHPDDAGGPQGSGLFTEREGYDAQSGALSLAEKQVGFAWYGHHWVEGTGCIGSEFTLAEVEALVNLPGYEMTNEQRRSDLPFQGLVLVEIFWQHDMLLKFPLFNPVLDAFGDETPTIAVWAAFPMPSVEPSEATMNLP